MSRRFVLSCITVIVFLLPTLTACGTPTTTVVEAPTPPTEEEAPPLLELSVEGGEMDACDKLVILNRDGVFQVESCKQESRSSTLQGEALDKLKEWAHTLAPFTIKEEGTGNASRTLSWNGYGTAEAEERLKHEMVNWAADIMLNAPARVELVEMDLQEYSDEAMGLHFKYPAGWNVAVDGEAKQITMTPQGGERPEDYGIVINLLGAGVEDGPDQLLDKIAGEISAVSNNDRREYNLKNMNGKAETFSSERDGRSITTLALVFRAVDGQVFRLLLHVPSEEFTAWEDVLFGVVLSFKPTIAVPPEAALCPEVARPAVVIRDPVNSPQTLTVTGLADETTCQLTLQGDGGQPQIVGGSIYYVARGGREQPLVWKMDETGAQNALEFTNPEGSPESYAFLVSRDGMKIAWAYSIIEGDSTLFMLHVADVDGANAVGVLQKARIQGAASIEPVRFSQDDASLYVAAQPGRGEAGLYDAGGVWNSLYRVNLAEGVEPALILNCDAKGSAPFCIHDLSEDERLIAYSAQDNSIRYMEIETGQETGSVQLPPVGFAGFAHFQGTNLIVYYTDLQPGPNGMNAPVDGYVATVPPPPHDTTPIVIAQGDGQNRIARIWKISTIGEGYMLVGQLDEQGRVFVSLISPSGEEDGGMTYRQLGYSEPVGVLF